MGAAVVVVANPTAGGGRAGRALRKADAILRAHRIDFEVRIPDSPAETTSTARRAAEEGATIVAALGGDGSIGCVANGIVGTDAALAVIPAGTANDLAKAVGAWRLEHAVRLLANPKVHPIDAVRVSMGGGQQRLYLNVAGAGFDSEVNETANAMRINLGGTVTYIASVLRTLSRFTPARFTVGIDDGERFALDAMLIVVGNAPAYGGGMKVLPGATLDDGVLDVCVVEAVGTAEFIRAFPRVYRGTHTTHPRVRMLRATSVSLEANRMVQVYADGDRVGPLPARFEVLPEAILAVVGPGAALTERTTEEAR
jgi:diacylglycerol kinase (ATP)